METIIKNTFKKLLELLEIPHTKININSHEKNYNINIESDDPSLLIGHHGENIQAFQHVAKLIIRNQMEEDDNINIYVDVDEYRQRQEQSVLGLAKRKAEMVRENKQPQLLPPMSSYFRRLIHLYLNTNEFSDLETESIGEGDRRQVVIKYKFEE